MSSGQQAAGSGQQAGSTGIRCALPAACWLLPALGLAAEPSVARERTVERLGVTARVRVEPGVVPIRGVVTLTFSVEGVAAFAVVWRRLRLWWRWRMHRGRDARQGRMLAEWLSVQLVRLSGIDAAAPSAAESMGAVVRGYLARRYCVVVTGRTTGELVALL